MHEYMRRINAAIDNGIIDVGMVAHALVSHDDDCDIHDCGECHCDPNIIIILPSGSISIKKDGSLSNTH